MSSIKGVVLAGGLGSRLYPLTRVTNKHLLPVFRKPMIFYPIQKLVEAGIREIMVVTGGNYAGEFLKLLRNGREFGLSDLHYAYQEGEGGIAEALSLAEPFVAGDRVCVVLGDNIFEDSIETAVESFQSQPSGGKVFLKEVSDPARFGCPELSGSRIVRIEEKPTRPASGYAVTGTYLYDNDVFDIIRTLSPSGRGEMEITDVNNAYIDRGTLTYDFLEGWWTDAGTFESLLRATNLVSRTPSLREPIAVECKEKKASA